MVRVGRILLNRSKKHGVSWKFESQTILNQPVDQAADCGLHLRIPPRSSLAVASTKHPKRCAAGPCRRPGWWGGLGGSKVVGFLVGLQWFLIGFSGFIVVFSGLSMGL